MALEFLKANGLWNEGRNMPVTLATAELHRRRYSKERFKEILQAYAELAVAPTSRKRVAASSSSSRKSAKIDDDDDTSSTTELSSRPRTKLQARQQLEEDVFRCSLCDEVVINANPDDPEQYCRICSEIGSELEFPDRIQALVYNIKMQHPQPKTGFSPLSFWDFAKMTNEEHHVQCLLNQKEYEDLLRAPCAYCSLNPAGHATRLSPAGDYEKDTVIACCPLCLDLKGNLRDSTFKVQVEKIALFYQRSLLSLL
jgi:hypothetical protein